ncbi:MAG: VWA domain-containing protein [Gammaproteobacteria bacterium]|nr:VWA domain-containing protein [Gammaproteobacteria bacterium]MDE0246518.1 VWA domain-containing protein [Gammaproteobacteria bacterium]
MARIMHFARLLRAAGMPVGPAQVIEAVRAVEAVGVTRRADVCSALHAVFVRRPEERALFAEAFRRYWIRSGTGQERLAELTRDAQRLGDPPLRPAGRRVREGLTRPGPRMQDPGRESRTEIDRMGYSPGEVLRTKDFAQMSVEEIEEAERAIEQMELPLREYPTRRFRPAPRPGRIDMRRSLRATVRGGRAGISLRYRAPAHRRPPLVLLVDISGSMGPYTRLFLRFVHALTRLDPGVETFLFGTRLSRVTRHFRHRDADVALAAVGVEVEDWAGGTRIGACLEEFNRLWARRVLARGAAVLLMTDGLERDESRRLEAAAERLQRSCRKLIWLNPLLRFEAFRPKAQGIRAILPHVDDFRPVHSLESLEELTIALGAAPAAPRSMGGRSSAFPAGTGRIAGAAGRR